MNDEKMVTMILEYSAHLVVSSKEEIHTHLSTRHKQKSHHIEIEYRIYVL